jgi:transposase
MQAPVATARKETIYVAIEMSNTQWRLAFTAGDKIRQVAITAGATAAFLEHLQTAREKLHVAADAPVFSCYEAGRDGFWFHRFLAAHAITNLVVDAGSMRVQRKHRLAKTDRLDADLLVRNLLRWQGGERNVWSVVRVPSVEAEDQRRLERERQRLKKEWTAHWARLWSLLALHGIRSCPKNRFLAHVAAARTWDGQPLPERLQAELRREYARVEQLAKQRDGLEAEQLRQIKAPSNAAEQAAAKLHRLVSLGPIGASALAYEFFGWRTFKNRREVGALAGLTDTPWSSGDLAHSQGISKAGNKRVRHVLIEVAWKWLRYQPDSALSQWYARRFAKGGARLRRIGIVALARKLLIVMWRWVAFDEVAAGIRLRPA